MDTIDPGEREGRSPQLMGEEFEALWAESMQRAEARPGLDLEELKQLSSRARRMARLSMVRESGIRCGEHFSWPANSRKAG